MAVGKNASRESNLAEVMESRLTEEVKLGTEKGHQIVPLLPLFFYASVDSGYLL